MNVNIPQHSCFKFLFDPPWGAVRYRVARGGRGGGKGWGFGRASLLRALETKRRILCCRHIQNSIAESIHHLLADQIQRLELSQWFTVHDRSITCANGSEYLFEGLYRNVDKIKSLENIDLCIITEAQPVDDESLDLLFPTIRGGEASEIWLEYNPKFEDDAVHKRFVLNPPPSAIVREINWDSNPDFPAVLLTEMEWDRTNNPHLCACKWDGKPTGAGTQIWTNFDREVHVKDFDWKWVLDRGNFVHSCDPHQHYWGANLFAAIVRANNRGSWPEDYIVWIYDELPREDDLGGPYHELRHSLHCDLSLPELASRIYAREGTAEHGMKVMKRYMDPRYATGTGSWSNATQGLVELWAKKENGGLIWTLPRVQILDSARQTVSEALMWNKFMPRSEFNQPHLYVSPKCKNLITSLTNHRLEQGSETEDEKYKDFSDSLRILYAGIGKWDWVDPLTGKRPPAVKRPVMDSYGTLAGLSASEAWMGA